MPMSVPSIRTHLKLTAVTFAAAASPTNWHGECAPPITSSALCWVDLARRRSPCPGGCDLGASHRPAPEEASKALGDIDLQGGFVYAQAPQKRLTGATIYMDQVSVGATINAILASVLANGLTVIENAAKEPHIVDVANFLNSMGANIMGVTPTSSRFTALESLPRRHLFHHPRPDRGRHLYGRSRRHRRRRPHPQHHPPAIWTASPPSWWRWALRSRRGRLHPGHPQPDIQRTNIKTMPPSRLPHRYAASDGGCALSRQRRHQHHQRGASGKTGSVMWTSSSAWARPSRWMARSPSSKGSVT